MPLWIEVTDTFGGEANYSWVKRFTVADKPGESDLSAMRRVKRAAGLNGVRCRVTSYGGHEWRLDVVGACICAFVSWAWDLDQQN